MKYFAASLMAASALLLVSDPVFAAGPPVGITMGPPASVTMGPPASVTMGPPASVTMGPPASVTMGPPASVTMGPPAAALAHIPDGVPLGQPAVLPQGTGASTGVTIGGAVSASAGPQTANGNAGLAGAASILGDLNAVHASAEGMTHASADSMVGEIATYKTAMTAALSETDQVTQTADITAAREQLASATNKQLTADAATQLDAQLGIQGADPALGTLAP